MAREMRAKQRLLNALTGKPVDRVPWAPFLAYYWDFLPEADREGGMAAYLRRMGADPLLRGMHQLFRLKRNRCTLSEHTSGKTRLSTMETPVGTLRLEHTFSPTANSWFVTKHPVVTRDDFKTLIYIFEHVDVEEALAEFEAEYIKFADDALAVPLIGTNGKTAFQSLVEHWCGTVELTYALYDHPELVREAIEVISAADLRTVEISARSSAEAFIFWEDSSTTNISPDMFQAYTMPQITQWGNVLHQSGKLLIHHACGHVRDLLPLMGETPIDAVESLSPFPTGNVTMAQARKLLPAEIAIIGGIDPVELAGSNKETLLAQTADLLRTMAGTRYVLANSDSCPPGVEYGKFTAISRLVQGGFGLSGTG